MTSWIVTFPGHYGDVIMGTTASQITSLTIVYSTVYSDADQRKHQSSTSLAFVRGIHRGPENSPHKWPVTRKMFPFDDVIMAYFTDVVIGLLAWISNYNQYFLWAVSSSLTSEAVQVNRPWKGMQGWTRFGPSQWETALLCNDVSHWLGASLQSALAWMNNWIV